MVLRTCLLIVASLLPGASAQPLAVEYRGATSLPATTIDQHGEELVVAGLSGVTWLGGNRYAAASDRGSIVLLEVRLTMDGRPRSASVRSGRTLPGAPDLEGIAWTGTGRETVFVSEEGTPSVREVSLADGATVAELGIADVYEHSRPNRGLESLSLTRIGGARLLVTANEEALRVDGDRSTPVSGSLVRVERFLGPPASDRTASALTTAGQFAYRTEPIHGVAIDGARSGLVDLVALPDGRLLALERSFALGERGLFQASIFEVDSTDATDVAAGDLARALRDHAVVPATKRLLFAGPVPEVGQNVEGMALGPRLAGGGHALVCVVDDGDPLSRNVVAVFRLTPSIGGPSIDDRRADGTKSARSGPDPDDEDGR